jgi:hypothetical protein
MKANLKAMNANTIAVNNQDVERASWMVAKTNGGINPIALGAKVAMIAELKRRLAKGEIVEWDFIKKSTGELRHAIGCLKGSLIAPHINGNGVPNRIYGNLTYFDLNRNSIRCMSYETITKIYA